MLVAAPDNENLTTRPTDHPPYRTEPDVLLLLAVHLAAAVVAPLLVRLMGRKAFWVLALAPASAAAWALSWTSQVQAGNGPVEQVEWIPALGLELTFRLRVLAWLCTRSSMLLLRWLPLFSKRLSKAFDGYSSSGTGEVAFCQEICELYAMEKLVS